MKPPRHVLRGFDVRSTMLADMLSEHFSILVEKSSVTVTSSLTEQDLATLGLERNG